MIQRDGAAYEVAAARIHRFSKNNDGSIGLGAGQALAASVT